MVTEKLPGLAQGLVLQHVNSIGQEVTYGEGWQLGYSPERTLQPLPGPVLSFPSGRLTEERLQSPPAACSPPRSWPSLPCRLTHRYSHQHQGPGRVAVNGVGGHLRVQQQPRGDGVSLVQTGFSRGARPSVHPSQPQTLKG